MKKTDGDLINEYLDYMALLKLSEHTIRISRPMLARFDRYLKESLGLSHVDEIRSEHLKKWYAYLSSLVGAKGYPLKPASINSHIGAVRGFMNYLCKRGYVRHSLLDHLPFLKTPRHLPRSVLTHAQVRRFLSRINTDSTTGSRDRAMFELLYSTGIRAGELVRLNTSDIDCKNATALINGKGDKQRVVPIGKTAIRYLKTYIKAVRPCQLIEKDEKALFLNIDGNRLSYNSFVKIMKNLRNKTKSDPVVTAHTFRRSCATELIRGNANIYHVKELLGHESLDTLRHYSRLTITDLKKTHGKCHPREKDSD